MVLEILMVVPVAGLYCSGGLRISIVGCSVGARGGWYHWHIVMLWHFPLGLVWGIPQFFFSCAGTKAPPHNFFFLCGHQGPSSGQSAVGKMSWVSYNFVIAYSNLSF